MLVVLGKTWSDAFRIPPFEFAARPLGSANQNEIQVNPRAPRVPRRTTPTPMFKRPRRARAHNRPDEQFQ